jgi:hypothetical protein
LEYALLYVAAAVLRARLPLFASSTCCNRRSLVFYDVVILLIIVLLISAMMNDCGFSRWSYQVFHLPDVAASLTMPKIFHLNYQCWNIPSPPSNLYNQCY